MTNDKRDIEEGTALSLDFRKLGKAAGCGQDLVPAVAQDVETGEVLIIAYANRQAFDYAVEHGEAAFWSTSRNELWVKGATSGDFGLVVSNDGLHFREPVKERVWLHRDESTDDTQRSDLRRRRSRPLLRREHAGRGRQNKHIRTR